VARYIDPDGRERSKTFPRKVDAERFLATVDADLLRGEWIDPRSGRKTFREWVEEFESSRVDLEATTRAQRSDCLRNHLLPHFGSRRLSAITEMRVRTFLAHLVKDGLAPATVTKNLRILSQILKAAVRNRLIALTPATGWSRRARRHVRRRSSSPRKRSMPWPMPSGSGSVRWCCWQGTGARASASLRGSGPAGSGWRWSRP